VRKINVNRTTFAGLLVAAFGLAPVTGFALPIVGSFGCAADTATCNGNEYGWAGESVDADTWQITVAVKITDAYTGNKWTDSLNSLALKNFVSDYANVSLVAAPTGLGDWNLSAKELNANGCQGGTNQTTCVQWNIAGNGVGFTSGDILSWTFQFDSAGPLNSLAHLKYRYVDSKGKKIGDLGSFDLSGTPSTTPTPVPEPSSLLLLGVGLLAVGVSRRRFQRSR
jgi:hypothetical protein